VVYLLGNFGKEAKIMTAKKIHFTGDVIEGIKKFVNIVALCDYDVDVASGRYVVDAKSIMGLFSLDLSNPLTVMIHSDECDEVLAKLDSFILK
jgi:phosphotransferase system HPr-like phosphotransfer protein